MTADGLFLASVKVVHFQIIVAVTAVSVHRVVKTTVQDGGCVPGMVKGMSLRFASN